MKHYKLPELSVFFPAYNEAGNIEEAVKQALFVLPRIADKYEVVIVNDGSHDATLSISRRLARRYKKVRVVTQKNKGYGGALKLGFKSCKYNWIFYTDADLQFDMAELRKFVRFTQTRDAIIGYRKNRAEGWKRQILAKGLKVWNHILLSFPTEIRDIDCAFKLLDRRILNHALPLTSDGAMVSTELLLKTHLAGFRFKQIGVTHYARRIGQPTGNNLRVIARAVRDTFILKYRLFSQTPAGQRLFAPIQFQRETVTTN